MKRTIATAVLLPALCGALLADPLPVPAADYRTKGTIAGGMTVGYRHSNGKLRMDMRSPEMPKPMVGYFDVRTRKGVMVMSIPGAPPMAIETGPDDPGNMGVAAGSGQRIGSDRVAGETCDLWKPEPESDEGRTADMVACITRDGILLRMVGNVDGKRQTIFEVTELERAPQDIKQLTPPPGLKPMQIPGGMMPQRK